MSVKPETEEIGCEVKINAPIKIIDHYVDREIEPELPKSIPPFADFLNRIYNSSNPLNDWYYAGGDYDTHYNYWKILKIEAPLYHYPLGIVQGKRIFIVHKDTGMVLAISKKFLKELPREHRYRTCFNCRKIMKGARVRYCPSCSDP